MLVLSSPSGAGKTTLSKKFNSQIITLEYQSHIQQEKQGQTRLMELIIILLPKKSLKSLLKKDAFYEHSVIFGNYYGTSKTSVDEITKKKFNVLFDIDWKGAKQLSAFKELNFLKFLYFLQARKN